MKDFLKDKNIKLIYKYKLSVIIYNMTNNRMVQCFLKYWNDR